MKKIKKIIIAIVMTLIMVIGAFVYPVFYRWCIASFLTIVKEADILLVMMSAFLWIGIFDLTVFLWIKAFDKD